MSSGRARIAVVRRLKLVVVARTVTCLVLSRHQSRRKQKMASFALPENMQESGRIWGPSTSTVSDQFKECVFRLFYR